MGLRRKSDREKLVRSHVLRAHNGDFTGNPNHLIDNVTDEIVAIIERAERAAVAGYRAAAIAENMNTDSKEIDFDGVGQFVYNQDEAA